MKYLFLLMIPLLLLCSCKNIFTDYHTIALAEEYGCERAFEKVHLLTLENRTFCVDLSRKLEKELSERE